MCHTPSTCFFVSIIKKLYIIKLARGYSPKGEIEINSLMIYICVVLITLLKPINKMIDAANKSNHKEFDDAIDDVFIQIVDKFFTWFL